MKYLLFINFLLTAVLQASDLSSSSEFSSSDEDTGPKSYKLSPHDLNYLGEKQLARGHSKEAYGYFLEAAEENYPAALRHIGDMAYFGLVIEQNYGFAFQMYHRAHRGKDIEGRNHLAIMHLNGEGTDVNVAKAVQYLKSSRAHHDINALGHLYEIYSKGHGGIKQSNQKAFMYLYEIKSLANKRERPTSDSLFLQKILLKNTYNKYKTQP